MESKTFHLNLQIEGIPPRTANLLKQEMLSVGGDAAVNARVFDCSTESTDAILTGTPKQIEALLLKLNPYPGLAPLAGDLKETLHRISKTRFVIRCRKGTFPLGERTLLMGVLNVTPDSFSERGLFFDKEKAIAQGLKMVEEGADMIDIGGESTRPGSKPLDLAEELRRVIPVIESLVAKVDTPISIDTYKSSVAKAALDAGAQLINDISALNFDPDLARVAAREDVPLILMHIRGIPETMQKDVHYDSLFSEILQSLKRSVEKAEAAGVNPEQIIIDPGIGFGKNLEDNLLIIRNLPEFRVLGRPILLGTSRKSFIGRLLNGADVTERLEGTLASTVIGIMNGAHIVRCHDVLQAKRAITIADAIRLAGVES
jgi:dihydropteroate synthase